MMKKIRIVLCMAICLLLPLTGLARNQLTWEQRSTNKLTRAVFTYVIEQGEDGTPQVRETGSLPAGTHIVFADYDRDTGLSKVVYNKSGSETEAWIRDRDALVSVMVRVNFDDGSHQDFPEALVNDKGALLRILRQMYPNRTINPIEGSSTFHTAEKGGGDSSSTAVPMHDDKSGTTSVQDEPTPIGDRVPAPNVTAQAKFQIDSPWRLKQTVTGYADAHKTKTSSSIPIGTYAQIIMDYNDVVQIGYYQNGVYHKAHIDRAALLNNFTQYRNQNGEILNISPADPLYEKTVSENEITYLSDAVQTNLDERVALSLEAAKKGVTVAQLGDEVVLVQQLGLVQSTVLSDGEEKNVPTTNLVSNASEQAEIRAAVIYAPRTGKCSLRATATPNSKVIRQCKAGTVVQVLSTENGYSKIVYHGTEGYVLSECLYHPDVSISDGHKTGILAYYGKTTGSTTINIRNSPDKSSAKVAEWKTGTPITILSHEDGWMMVEANGVCGYVLGEFINYE